MIIHIRYPSGIEHALVGTTADGPLILASWGRHFRVPTARVISLPEAKTVVGHWRDHQKRGDLVVMSANWDALKEIVPLATAEENIA